MAHPHPPHRLTLSPRAPGEAGGKVTLSHLYGVRGYVDSALGGLRLLMIMRALPLTGSEVLMRKMVDLRRKPHLLHPCLTFFFLVNLLI